MNVAMLRMGNHALKREQVCAALRLFLANIFRCFKGFAGIESAQCAMVLGANGKRQKLPLYCNCWHFVDSDDFAIHSHE
jgi:hypothetical protein